MTKDFDFVTGFVMGRMMAPGCPPTYRPTPPTKEELRERERQAAEADARWAEGHARWYETISARRAMEEEARSNPAVPVRLAPGEHPLSDWVGSLDHTRIYPDRTFHELRPWGIWYHEGTGLLHVDLVRGGRTVRRYTKKELVEASRARDLTLKLDRKASGPMCFAHEMAEDIWSLVVPTANLPSFGEFKQSITIKMVAEGLRRHGL